MRDRIVIRGAREHNLKNIDLEIPRNKLVVITGLSGSGKSSLAFDTIYAEGQRKYVESLSAYARQFLGQLQKPDVEHIEGLSPAISIEQRSAGASPRSTVATTTEIYDYLRLLYANIGQPHCHKCGKPVSSQSEQEIVDRILELPDGTQLTLLAPMVRGRKGEHKDVIERLRKDGYVRVRINGKIVDLADEIKLDKRRKNTIEVVVDRLVIKHERLGRLSGSVEGALKLGQGLVVASASKNEQTYSTLNACSDCGISFEKLMPRHFSFNSPYGACSKCHGLGTIEQIDPTLVVPDASRSLNESVLVPWQRRDAAQSMYRNTLLEALAAHYSFRLDVPFRDLPEKVQQIILFGSGKDVIEVKLWSQKKPFEGVIPNLERRYHETESMHVRKWLKEFMSVLVCPDCGGKRLRPESLAVTVSGRSIIEVTEQTIEQAIEFLRQIGLTPRQQKIAAEILKEILSRLTFMQDVGVGYLTLDRVSSTLSGGEAQRIRLATQMGAGLVGVLYILDEPSIGLHQRDNQRLLDSLCELRDLGNTVIVVEHDEATIRAADFVVDLGPGAGVNGGEVVATGTIDDILAEKRSLTGQYLSRRMQIEVPQKRKVADPAALLILKGAREHNLKDLAVKVPLGLLVCITGVSGSGKSSLVSDTLLHALRRALYGSRDRGGDYDELLGAEQLDRVVIIDQSPIGRTPRSNPATYTGVFTLIRELFSKLTEARMHGYGAGRFSFNVSGGRCEACQGDGVKRIEMHFLPDVYVTCDVCGGRRYKRETLEVRYRGKSIYDVLEMTVEEALAFFHHVPRLRTRLQTMFDVGLGYIKLGQSATTLSGGEAQRIKLAAELSKTESGRSIYLLDEPTTGLHFADIHRLLDVLARLTARGNTVVVIEHNLDVVKCADWVIDLGPEGGEAGGYIVAAGTPEQVAACAESYTGQYLCTVLPAASRKTGSSRDA
ncbi:MAG: excinuclease ABC subunit UvrA [Verrucomicrobia bacterium]|nr:excinuclease ABC subunit UvrA [Verrucomicrobiota bacterium]